MVKERHAVDKVIKNDSGEILFTEIPPFPASISKNKTNSIRGLYSKELIYNGVGRQEAPLSLYDTTIVHPEFPLFHHVVWFTCLPSFSPRGTRIS